MEQLFQMQKANTDLRPLPSPPLALPPIFWKNQPAGQPSRVIITNDHAEELSELEEFGCIVSSFCQHSIVI